MKKHSFRYTGNKTREISFPLGGIGTGCVGLGGNGRLFDWEIDGRPNKGSYKGFSHIAVKAVVGDKVYARVLQGDMIRELTGPYVDGFHYGFGVGPLMGTMVGFPHFKNCTFKAEFPFATLTFQDDGFPGRVTLTAFNPLIPLDVDNSSIPAAFFTVTFHNDTEEEIEFTAAFSAKNLYKAPSVNQEFHEEGISGVHIVVKDAKEDSIANKQITIATDIENAPCQEYWYKGGWFDSATTYWREFSSKEHMPKRHIDDPTYSIEATVAPFVKAKAGEDKSIRFVLSWNCPYTYNYWEESKDESVQAEIRKPWKNYYATMFESSLETAKYCHKNFTMLEKKSKVFSDEILSSTLPKSVLEAAIFNISILKTATVLRLTDGSFYGWEGQNQNSGSCEGSCTHVWNYAYALPFLFPSLERSMRDLDYKYNMMDNGGMTFRLKLPLGRKATGFPCVDGQMGGVIKVYRDWKLCGDDEWLKSLWPSVKKSLEYAWIDDGCFGWDCNKDGVLEGRQHHTLDMELFGPNSWLQGFYIAALKAAAEMADYLGESDKANEYSDLAKKGQEYCDKELFQNGYYMHKVDLNDHSIIDRYPGCEERYWNSEVGEIKYQIGEGSAIDQVLAQWHANLCGLGEIYDKEKLLSALKSIYRYNYKPVMRDFCNPCRIFSANGESGTVICAYPEDVRKPAISVPYAEETMPGMEYAVAQLMISEGMIEEGERLISGIRNRFDGDKRNPFNEFECGSNYARSMASYSAIPIYSGFEFDMPKGFIGFSPIKFYDGVFKTIWSIDSGWGTVKINESSAKIKIIGGELQISVLKLGTLSLNENTEVKVDGKVVKFVIDNGNIRFNVKVTVKKSIAVRSN